MTTSNFAHSDGLVNSAVFSNLPAAFIGLDPFQPIEGDPMAGPDEWDAFVEAGYRGGLVEWARGGFGRCVCGDARLPRDWLPFDALYAAIRRVPMPVGYRLGSALALSQREADKRKKQAERRDTDYHGWYVNLEDEWTIDLEGTRSGWYRLRVASPERLWDQPLDMPPYPHSQPIGTVIYRTQDLGTIGQFLDKLKREEGAAQRLAKQTVSNAKKSDRVPAGSTAAEVASCS